MFINCFWLLSVLNAGLGFVGRNLVCYLVEHELCSKVRISLFEPLVKATPIIHGKENISKYQCTNQLTCTLKQVVESNMSKEHYFKTKDLTSAISRKNKQTYV